MDERLAGVLRNNLRAALRRAALDEADELLQRLRLEDPASLETRGLELEWLVRSKRTGEAATLAAALVAQFPASPRVLLWAGRAAYQRKDYASAIELFGESLRLAPHWSTEHWLGKSLTQTGRFDRAQAVLERLAPQHPICLLDLAWLHERREEPEQALRCVDAYLERFPDDTYAQDRRRQLRAAVAGAADVVAEVETLRAMSEPVPAALLPSYLDGLLRTGRGTEARGRVRELLPGMAARTATRLGWVAYKLQAWDIALDLFLVAVPDRPDQRKQLVALERVARLCARTEELARVCEALAAREPAFWGRAKRIRGGARSGTRGRKSGVES
ncbi:MAG: tetratricopeptide repeat protein [Deltaproteobacteria bacterium]|nr:tetratricopeptide repeat protein [Deltaproteobacteria bacterium]